MQNDDQNSQRGKGLASSTGSLMRLAERLRDPELYVDACDEAANLIEALNNPSRVHASILSGTIKLTKEQALHIGGYYADDFQANAIGQSRRGDVQIDQTASSASPAPTCSPSC